MSTIKSILGLNKNREATETIVEKAEFEAAIPGLGEGTNQSTDTEIDLLQKEIEAERHEDPITFAAEQLSDFKLTPGARSLLDRAMDNLSTSNGQGIKDEDARAEIQDRAAFIKGCGNDLSIAISSLVEVVDPLDAPGAVYSLLFNVLKAAVFIGNLDLRRYLDPDQDYDLENYADKREEHRDAPYGMETREEREFQHMRQLYGADFQSFEDAPACALSDLRYFFQLNVESLGWNPDNVMPFSMSMNPDGTFAPINDPQQALDAAELRRQASRAKKRDQRSKTLAAAQKAATEKVKAALARRAG